MAESKTRTAVLEATNNAPALDTGAPIAAQFAVNLGAICADAWLELDGRIRLHDYAACQSDAFMRELAQYERSNSGHQLVMLRRAFSAGLMGRIQQHLLAALGIVTRDVRATH